MNPFSVYKVSCKIFHDVKEQEAKIIFSSTDKGEVTLSKRRFCPLTIPNHSTLIIICMQNLNKSHEKILKLSIRNEVDRWNQGQTLEDIT